MHIAIIGAGAAGCFASIEIKRQLPEAQVTVYESLKRPLVKVGITGGGRCNLTNSFKKVKSMEQVYPRGARLMKRLFRHFDHHDTCRWFESHGVKLLTQEDECVFPVSQQAAEIVNTLLRCMERSGVKLLTSHRVSAVLPPTTADGNFTLQFHQEAHPEAHADLVLIATGGQPKAAGTEWLRHTGLKLLPPVPSLFSLSMPDHPFNALSGLVVREVTTSIPGTKFKAEGPLLITHNGLSGPAILKLSAHAARYMNEHNYRLDIAVNWWGNENEAEIFNRLLQLAAEHPKKQLKHIYPPHLQSRLWTELLKQSKLDPEGRWNALNTKGLNRLASQLTHSVYTVAGKNPFKEEFVTCGGIDLNDLLAQTLESKLTPGLFAAGEVTDVDAVTGGFNLQAAWTMGFIAAQGVVKRATDLAQSCPHGS